MPQSVVVQHRFIIDARIQRTNCSSGPNLHHDRTSRSVTTPKHAIRKPLNVGIRLLMWGGERLPGNENEKWLVTQLMITRQYRESNEFLRKPCNFHGSGHPMQRRKRLHVCLSYRFSHGLHKSKNPFPPRHVPCPVNIAPKGTPQQGISSIPPTLIAAGHVIFQSNRGIWPSRLGKLPNCSGFDRFGGASQGTDPSWIRCIQPSTRCREGRSRCQ